MLIKVPVISRVEEWGPIHKHQCELVRTALVAAAQTGTHQAVWEMLEEGYRNITFHTIGWELNRILDETGEVNDSLWDVFVQSTFYMIKRYHKYFRGDALYRWMQEADTDEKKKEIIRSVVPLDVQQRSA